MADSQKYGRTANLFDDEIASGYYNDNGELVSDTSTSHSTTYIPVDGTTYTISGLWTWTTNFAVYEWDNNKNWLRRSNRQVPAISTLSFTVGSDAAFFTLQIKTEHGNIMLNIGSTALPYQPYNAWQHSLRKLTTATETIENPLYSDGTAITAYTIKGNTVQNGTPTPSNPVEVQGVGDLGNNMFNGTVEQGSFNSNTGEEMASTIRVRTSATNLSAGTYTINASGNVAYVVVYVYDNGTYKKDESLISWDLSEMPRQFTLTATRQVRFAFKIDDTHPCRVSDISNIMLNAGSTAKPYEPYGFKIPITSGGVTTNIYLGSTQSNRQIGKITFDGSDDEQWSERQSPANSYVISIPAERVDGICTHLTQVSAAASLVDDTMYVGATAMSMKVGGISSLTDFKAWLADNKPTVWYVLATPTTGIVNEPLMKIGTYADTLSNAASIPTTEGANSITVDTTVQPSEFTATWTGWHDASVKEKSENLWDENMSDISSSMTYKPLYVGDNTVTMSSIIPQTSQGYANLFLKRGISDSGATTGDNGVWDGNPRTFEPINGWVTVAYRNANGVNPQDYNIMLNTGSTALPYEPYWK